MIKLKQLLKEVDEDKNSNIASVEDEREWKMPDVDHMLSMKFQREGDSVFVLNNPAMKVYKIRKGPFVLEEPIENSARFIYLMRTCYNGLYRVNKKNEFNTPMGKYENPIICDEENLIAVSETLIKADIKYKDFSKIIPNKGDFVYFDPPYYPVNNDSFVNYVFDGFNEKDQLRLRDFAMELSRNGINVMLSNSDSEFINNIYKKNFNINKVLVPRVINCKADGRQSIYETLITSY